MKNIEIYLFEYLGFFFKRDILVLMKDENRIEYLNIFIKRIIKLLMRIKISFILCFIYI